MQHSRHVAIIDDDVSMRVALTRLLRLHGFDSRAYRSAIAFLAALPTAKPFCLILDVDMPEMTGLELQRELLAIGVHIPTIIMTALDDEHVAVTAKSLGAIAFLSKPLSQDTLIAAIRAAGNKLN